MQDNAVVYTRQEAIRAAIQAVVWLSWTAALVWYSWPFWMLVIGRRSTTFDAFAFDWTSGGWFGVYAAMFIVRYAVRSTTAIFGTLLPYIVKNLVEPSAPQRGRRNAR